MQSPEGAKSFRAFCAFLWLITATATVRADDVAAAG
jgi:hypothetical protein